MQELNIIAIDPGATGSMCHITDNKVSFLDFKRDGLVGYINYLKTIKKPTIASIEKVNSMPGQGVKSVFSFGQRLGELEGMLQTLEIGYVLTRPQEWQKACGVKPKSKKKGIYDVVSKIYPGLELIGPRGGILDGRCDALGIAHFLRKTY